MGRQHINENAKENNKNNGTTYYTPNKTNNPRTKIPRDFQTRQDNSKTKKGKPIYEIGSYRPLNNLSTIKKIIEEYFITHLEPFLTKNKIIHDNHHGGRKATAQPQ